MDVVDKTKEIKYIIDNFDFVFFSRPKRFGKSITLDTIALLFSKGLEPYFKDTYIAGNNEDGSPRWDGVIYPVVRLDFSKIRADELSEFRQLFVAQLNIYNKAFGLDKSALNVNIAQTFEEFTCNIIEKYPKGFVLLVDEYDAPLNALIDDIEKFEILRKEIRDFYATIKSDTVSQTIRFMLVTGITRFKDVSIFSAGSNIVDISYDSNIATIVGYTREEM